MVIQSLFFNSETPSEMESLRWKVLGDADKVATLRVLKSFFTYIFYQMLNCFSALHDFMFFMWCLVFLVDWVYSNRMSVLHFRFYHFPIFHFLRIRIKQGNIVYSCHADGYIAIVRSAALIILYLDLKLHFPVILCAFTVDFLVTLNLEKR